MSHGFRGKINMQHELESVQLPAGSPQLKQPLPMRKGKVLESPLSCAKFNTTVPMWHDPGQHTLCQNTLLEWDFLQEGQSYKPSHLNDGELEVRGGLCASGEWLYCKGVSNPNLTRGSCWGFSEVPDGFKGLNMVYHEAIIEPGGGVTTLAPGGWASLDYAAPGFALGSESREICVYQLLPTRRSLSAWP